MKCKKQAVSVVLVLTTVAAGFFGAGAGRTQAAVIAGDAAGAQQDECWGSGFAPTYNLKPWSPAEDTGDPSLCPDFPTTP